MILEDDDLLLDDMTKAFLSHDLDLFDDPWVVVDEPETEEAPRLDFWNEEDDEDFWRDKDYQPWNTPEEQEQAETTFKQSTPGSSASFQAAQAATMPSKRWYKQENGRIPEAKLVTVQGLGRYKPDAAAALKAMKRAAKKDGIILRGGGYRSYEEQEALQYKEALGIPVAEPGHSNHGWGTAGDFDVNDPKTFAWLQKNAKRFGWVNPEWAQNGVEPWHWEYQGGFKGAAPKKTTKLKVGPTKDKTKPNPTAPELITGRHGITEPGDFVEGFLSAVDDHDREVMARPATTPTRGGLGKIDDVEKLAKTMARRRGWSGQEWRALHELVSRESSWDPSAQNETSTAYGLFQFLDSTWDAYGFDKTDDPYGQIRAGLAYIKRRYGTPSNALRFHSENGWY